MRTSKRQIIVLVLGIAIALVAIGAPGLVAKSSPVGAAESAEVELVGRWPFGPAFAVVSTEIGGTPYTLLGSGGALLVLDITDPANPNLVSSIVTPSVVRGLAATGNLALVANDEAGLRVIDISDPTDPVEVGFYDTPGVAQGVAMKDDLALVADYFTGLRFDRRKRPNQPCGGGLL